jgi:uncharacterized protein with HEPN domain
MGLDFFDMQNLIEDRVGKKVALVYLRNLKPGWKEAILQEIHFLDDETKPSVPISPETLSHLYLEDLRETVTTIATYLQGISLDDFARDHLRLDATIYNLITLGKIAKRLPDPIRQKTPSLPWQQMIDDGARLIKKYNELNIAEIWNFCTKELPTIEKELSALVHLSTEKHPL